MPAAVKVIPLPVTPEGKASFDVGELADEAAEALEAYRRAPWLQMNQRIRIAKLRHALELLRRIEGLESGRIPMPIWGD